MKDKIYLMKKLYIVAAIFGYFCLSRFQVEFKLLFIILGFIVLIIYIFEVIKNNYNKISILISILAVIMFILLFINEIIAYKYPKLIYLQGYIMAFLTAVILVIMIVAAIDYIKISNRRSGILTIITLSFIMLCVIFVIIGIILKKCGVIPE